LQERRILRTGGASVILAGVLVLATIPLIPVLIPSLNPPSTQAGLQALQTQGTLYSITWALYLVSDLLYLIGFFALYSALKPVARALVSAAVVLNTGFVALDVGLDIPLRLSLVGLSSSYASAQAGQQAGFVAAAQQALDQSNVVALAATLLQFLALILASYSLLKRPEFRKRFAYVGFACGLVALLFIPAFLAQSQLAGLFNIAGFLLLVVWSLGVGSTLYRLGNRG